MDLRAKCAIAGLGHEVGHHSYAHISPVAQTEPGVKGDTVSNVTKPATLETGGVVMVPLFVNVGDKLKIDPREKRYISRA